MYFRRTSNSRRFGTPALVLLGLLTGCGSTAATSVPPPPAPTATATVTVGFAVDVTPAPSARPRHPKAIATIMPFSAPKTNKVWMVLSPRSGPPVSRTIVVRAGNLPARLPAVMSWSPLVHGAPLTTSTETGPHGNLTTSFSIPAAQPGTYRLSLDVQGVRYVSATYRISSLATLAASVMPTSTGDAVNINGNRFLPRAGLLLVAYSIVRGHSPIVLGTARADNRGHFSVRLVSRALQPGDYVLRAWSIGLLESETADAFFQVVV